MYLEFASRVVDYFSIPMDIFMSNNDVSDRDIARYAFNNNMIELMSQYGDSNMIMIYLRQCSAYSKRYNLIEYLVKHMRNDILFDGTFVYKQFYGFDNTIIQFHSIVYNNLPAFKKTVIDDCDMLKLSMKYKRKEMSKILAKSLYSHDSQPLENHIITETESMKYVLAKYYIDNGQTTFCKILCSIPRNIFALGEKHIYSYKGFQLRRLLDAGNYRSILQWGHLWQYTKTIVVGTALAGKMIVKLLFKPSDSFPHDM